MRAAAQYLDERENTQLYTLENGEIRETDRYEAIARIEDTETEYQQHLTFTTTLDASMTYVNEKEVAEQVAKSIQQRRPDAELYALAVHSDGKGEEKHVHVHAIVGTATTLRRDDLTHYREEAYKLEQQLIRENEYELTLEERIWVNKLQAERQTIHSHEQNQRAQENER